MIVVTRAGLTNERLGRPCLRCAPLLSDLPEQARSRAQLAASCAAGPWFVEQRPWAVEEHLLETVGRVERARVQVQKWFPFGVGAAFGDLMPDPDGGGDLLQALVDVFASATTPFPQRWPACPRGGASTDSCDRDLFGRLQHTRCSHRWQPLPGETAHWARWIRRLIDTVLALEGRQFIRRLVACAQLGTGPVGPMRFVVNRTQGPAHAGDVSSPALFGLYEQLMPGCGLVLAWRVHRWLRSWRLPLQGAQFTPSTTFGNALLARHVSLWLPDEPLARYAFDQLQAELGINRNLVDALLAPGWDARPLPAPLLAGLLKQAARAASTADTPTWERVIAGKRILSLDHAVTVSGLTLAELVSQPDSDPGLGIWTNLASTVFNGMRADEKRVLLHYCATSTTWEQAALDAGHPGLGERVRRKLRRLVREYQDQHARATTVPGDG